MTQALSLANILRGAGHQVCRVIVGKSERRSIPQFFTDKIGAPVEHLDSPNFVTDKQQKSVKVWPSIVQSISSSPRYRKSIERIHDLVLEDRPDVIINFYDFLGGIYYFLKRPKAKLICIAHQYLIAHPEFDFPPNRAVDKLTLHLANKITSLGASKILALSFQRFKDQPAKQLYVVPPLLRDEVCQQPISQEDHFLIYMVNPGYAAEVDRFHQKYPNQPLHCFWDKKDMPQTLEVDASLTYHQLNDTLFIQKMASARGYVTTAGFESVCEAMYMGKPVLMVPVQGHYEQACNAIDAKKAGAGIYSESFDIEKLYEYLPRHQDISLEFQGWADQAKNYFLKYLT